MDKELERKINSIKTEPSLTDEEKNKALAKLTGKEKKGLFSKKK